MRAFVECHREGFTKVWQAISATDSSVCLSRHTSIVAVIVRHSVKLKSYSNQLIAD